VLKGKYEKKILLVEYTRQAGLGPRFAPKPMKKGTFILFLKKLDEKKVEHYKNMSKSHHKDKAEFYKRTDNVHYTSFEASDKNVKLMKALKVVQKKLDFKKVEGYFMSAKYPTKDPTICLVFKDKASWEKVFLRNRPPYDQKKITHIDFDKYIAIAVVKCGNNWWEMKTESVALLNSKKLVVKYAAKCVKKGMSWIANQPHIIMIEKLSYSSVAFTENGKVVKTLEAPNKEKHVRKIVVEYYSYHHASAPRVPTPTPRLVVRHTITVGEKDAKIKTEHLNTKKVTEKTISLEKAVKAANLMLKGIKNPIKHKKRKVPEALASWKWKIKIFDPKGKSLGKVSTYQNGYLRINGKMQLEPSEDFLGGLREFNLSPSLVKPRNFPPPPGDK
jgi:hypothetical protein